MHIFVSLKNLQCRYVHCSDKKQKGQLLTAAWVMHR